MKTWISENLDIFSQPIIIGYGEGDFEVKYIDRNLSNKMIIENHYSKTISNTSFIYFGVYYLDKLLGTLQFGYAMNPASGGSLVEGIGNNEWCELNRMWLHDCLPKNTASRVMSYCISMIKRFNPAIKFIQSFADERCGLLGTVYQASNFVYYGKHVTTFYTDGIEYFHKIALTTSSNKGGEKGFWAKQNPNLKPVEYNQYRYIFFIDKRLRKRFKLKEHPYPKPVLI